MARKYYFHPSVTDVDRMLLRMEELIYQPLSYRGGCFKTIITSTDENTVAYKYTCLLEKGHSGVHAAFGSEPLVVWSTRDANKENG